MQYIQIGYGLLYLSSLKKKKKKDLKNFRCFNFFEQLLISTPKLFFYFHVLCLRLFFHSQNFIPHSSSPNLLTGFQLSDMPEVWKLS